MSAPRSFWQGPRTYREEDSGRFFGRGGETYELSRLVMRERLVVLHGESGHGKSSIIQAGIVPELRRRGFFPVVLRDLFRDAGSDITRLLLEAVERDAAAWGVRAPVAVAGDTLWEYFHRAGAEFVNSRGGRLEPVLILDQFEDVFRRLGWDGGGVGKVAQFVRELAGLVENREPDSVRQVRLEGEPGDAFDYERRDFRVVIVIREDALPCMTPMRDLMPSLARSPARLERLSEAGAMEVICKPIENEGSSLLGSQPRETARQILAAMNAGTVEGAGRTVDPFLLSVIMDRLQRRAEDGAGGVIDGRLIESGVPKALDEFYESAMSGVDTTLRDWLESGDHLVTADGFRKSITLGDARRASGDAERDIRRLEDFHLLRREARADGPDRLELVHDRFCAIVASRTAERLEKKLKEEAAAEKRRVRTLQRAVMAACAMLAIAVACAWFAYARWQDAVEARKSADAMRAVADGETRAAIAARERASQAAELAKQQQASAERAAREATEAQQKLREYVLPGSRQAHESANLLLRRGGEWRRGIAELAKAVALDPNNDAAASHLWMALATHAPGSALLPAHVVPVAAGVKIAVISRDGQRFAVWDNKGICRVFETATAQLITECEPEPPNTRARYFFDVPVCLAFKSDRGFSEPSFAVVHRLENGRWTAGKEIKAADANEDGQVALEFYESDILVAEMKGKWLRLFDPTTGQKLAESSGENGDIGTAPGRRLCWHSTREAALLIFDRDTRSIRKVPLPAGLDPRKDWRWEMNLNGDTFAAWNTGKPPSTELIQFGLDGKAKRKTTFPAPIQTVIVSPSGAALLVSTTDGGQCLVWDDQPGFVNFGNSRDWWAPFSFLPDELSFMAAGDSLAAISRDRFYIGSGAARNSYSNSHSRALADPSFSIEMEASSVIVWDNRLLPFDCDVLPGFSSELQANWLPDGKRLQLFDFSGDAFLHTLNADTLEVQSSLNLTNDAGEKLAFFESGKEVISHGRRLLAADVETGAVLPRFEKCTNAPFEDVRRSPDGRHYFFRCNGGKIHVIERTTGKEVARWQHTDSMLAVHPGGLLNLAVAADRKTVRVQKSPSLLTEDQSPPLQEQKDEVLATSGTQPTPIALAGFSRDGSQFFTLTEAGAFQLWETASGKALAQEPLELKSFKPEEAAAWEHTPDGDFVFSDFVKPQFRIAFRDGKLTSLPTSGDDTKLRLSFSFNGQIDALNRSQPLSEPFAATDPSAKGFQFSPDGRRMVVGNKDHLLRLYSLPDPNSLTPPTWAPEFATAIAGLRQQADGTPFQIPERDRLAIVQRLHREHPGDGHWERLLGYWATPPSQRHKGMFATRTLDETLEKLLALPPEREGFLMTAHQDALMRIVPHRPGNGLIYLALAALEAPLKGSEKRADYLRKYGLQRVPDDRKSWLRAAEILKWERHALAADAASKAEKAPH